MRIEAQRESRAFLFCIHRWMLNFFVVVAAGCVVVGYTAELPW